MTSIQADSPSMIRTFLRDATRRPSTVVTTIQFGTFDAAEVAHFFGAADGGTRIAPSEAELRARFLGR